MDQFYILHKHTFWHRRWSMGIYVFFYYLFPLINLIYSTYVILRQKLYTCPENTNIYIYMYNFSRMSHGDANKWAYRLSSNINSMTHPQHIPQSIQYTDPMLVQCWATVCDAAPTLNQHCVYISRLPCLL